MGKYDDFDLDLKKVMSNNTASEAESVVSILQTLATECFTFDGSNTCIVLQQIVLHEMLV